MTTTAVRRESPGDTGREAYCSPAGAGVRPERLLPGDRGKAISRWLVCFVSSRWQQGVQHLYPEKWDLVQFRAQAVWHSLRQQLLVLRMGGVGVQGGGPWRKATEKARAKHISAGGKSGFLSHYQQELEADIWPASGLIPAFMS